MARVSKRRPATRLQPGAKRELILNIAVEQFGDQGYEDTKWADIASAVGIGSTALYHYFESKQHCLFEILATAVAEFHERFDRLSAAHDDWAEALVAVLIDQFDLSEHDVLRNRVLVAEMGRLAVERELPREMAARANALGQMHSLEAAWRAFLERGMHEGAIPVADPTLLTRALLGLYNSVWHWYRPSGQIALDELRRYYVSGELMLLGCPPELIETLAER